MLGEIIFHIIAMVCVAASGIAIYQRKPLLAMYMLQAAVLAKLCELCN